MHEVISFARRIPRCVVWLLAWVRNVSGLMPTSHGQKMRQHVGGDTKRHQGGEMGAQLVQLRCRSTMRSPAHACRAVTTTDTTKPRQLHRHSSEQRRHLMSPPTFDVTPTATGRTLRAPNRMIAGLRSDDRLLRANQKLLRLCQRQPQMRDVTKVTARPELHHVNTSFRVPRPFLDQPQNPPHPPRPPGSDPGGHTVSIRTAHFLDSPESRPDAGLLMSITGKLLSASKV